jgi:hypothetical protein
MGKVKSHLIGLVTLGITGAMAGVSQAATVVLDDYSTDKSASYSFNQTFPDEPTATNTFAVSNGRLTPAIPPGVAQSFIYKDAGLAVGDKVSLDVTFSGFFGDKYAGIRLATGTDRTSIGAGQEYQLRIDATGSNGKFYDFSSTGQPLVELDGNLSGLGDLTTLTIERLANAGIDASLKITVAGAGFPEQSFNRTFTGAGIAPALFFGPNSFTGGSPGGVEFDNLTLTTAAVPEPASMVLLPALGALALRRRGRQL